MDDSSKSHVIIMNLFNLYNNDSFIYNNYALYKSIITIVMYLTLNKSIMYHD